MSAIIVHVSTHTPRPGREDALIASMHRFGAAGASRPGFVEGLVLRDTRSGRLVGMARWQDEASWHGGVQAMRAAVADDPFDDWQEDDPEILLLEEV